MSYCLLHCMLTASYMRISHILRSETQHTEIFKVRIPACIGDKLRTKKLINGS